MILFSNPSLSYLPYSSDQLKIDIARLFEKFKPLFENEILATPHSLLFDSSDDYHASLSNYVSCLAKAGDIIRVDGQFKALRTFEPGTELASPLHLSVQDYHDQLLNIKLTCLKHHQFKHTIHGIYLMQFELKNGDKFSFFVRQDNQNETKHLINRIINALPARYIERILRKHHRQNLPVLEPAYWGQRRQSSDEWDQDEDASDFYKDIVYPMLLDMFRRHIFPMQKSYAPLNVLDIGAGKGKLAEMLIIEAQSSNTPINLFLLEPDLYQAKLAAKRLHFLKVSYRENYVCQTTVINTSFEEFVEKHPACKQKIQAAVSSGGPFNAQVVSQQAALANLSKVKDILAPGGKFVSAGLTANLFTKRDLLNQTFSVLNTVKKMERMDHHGIFQCYVCETPSSSPPSLFFKNPKEIDTPSMVLPTEDTIPAICALM